MDKIDNSNDIHYFNNFDQISEKKSMSCDYIHCENAWIISLMSLIQYIPQAAYKEVII